MSSHVVLYACSKCFTRHPFEELSHSQQLCKTCRGSYPVKCTYCRSEFQLTSKGSSTSTICCKRCDANVKQYGKPTACCLCNIIAAFIGNKCQRCTHSEAKYGPAVSCEQCKQRCAFDRHDDNKKIDGKLLCWLCTLATKRAQAKARQAETERRAGKKRTHSGEKPQIKENSGGGNSNGSGLNNLTSSGRGNGNNDLLGKNPLPDLPPEKVGRMVIDPNSSDHVVAMTQLKETIASLQKKINMKDKELLERDKMITELKAKNFDAENAMRVKLKDSDRLYEMKLDVLNKKIAGLVKELATVVKTAKRGAGAAARDREAIKDSGGSGTDSPVTN